MLNKKGIAYYFEIKIEKSLDSTNMKLLLEDPQAATVYFWGVDLITTGDNLDLSVRDTLVSMSNESYPTRVDALTAANVFIESYKEKIASME